VGAATLVGPALDRVALPAPLEACTAAHLTIEQLAALDQGPGRVHDRVVLEPFADAAQLNNFALFFSPEGSIAGVIYHRILCNRRFEIVYPEFTAALRGNFLALRDSHVQTSAKEQALLHAYRLMEGLVDRSDPGVIDDAGRVHQRYLWQ